MPAPPSRAQRALARAMRRQFGPQFGLGGDAWDAYAPAAGDGVTADGGHVLAGVWSGYVRRTDPTQEGQAGAGVVVGVDQWVAHGDSAAVVDGEGAAAGALGTGWIIVSRAEAGRAYLIGSPVDVAGYARWQASPTAPPATEGP